MQNNILKTALIGVGNMGRKYAEMITAGEVPHMKLTAVVIRRDELMEWGKSLVNTDGEKVKIFRSAEELFAAEAKNTNDYRNNKEDNYYSSWVDYRSVESFFENSQLTWCIFSTVGDGRSSLCPRVH